MNKERIKITIHQSNKWALIINDEGDLWIAKEETIFNPLDTHWTRKEITHAKSFCEYLNDKVIPEMPSIADDFAEMVRDINSLIDKRTKNDFIAAQEKESL